MKRAVLGLGAALAVLGSSSAASALPVKRTGKVVRVAHGKPDVDRRPDAGRLTRRGARIAAAGRADLRRALGRQGVLTIDARTGTPRSVARLDGFLTGPSPRPAAEVALGFVRAHASAFGLTEADIAALRLARGHTDAQGITHLAWEQSVDGVPVFGHGLIANVAADGRLINVHGAPVPDLRLRSVTPRKSAAASLRSAFADVDIAQVPPRATKSSGRRTEFTGGHSAELVVIVDGPGRLRLAWRTLTNKDSDEVYDHLVDASTGDVVMRRNAVDFATVNVWEYAPNVHAICGECAVEAGQQTTRTVPTTNGTKLEGPFGRVFADLDDDNVVDAGEEIAANAGTNWSENFTPVAGQGCGPVFPLCGWDSATPNSWQTNRDQNAAQVYYFLNRFHDWLAAAPFNFSGAGEFRDADRVEAHILDGASKASGLPDEDHLNNANMLTLPDGSAPRMQMYLFEGPDTNGGDDASVVYHEYVHGLSNRLVTDARGNPALFSHQATSMGEGWSDWYAMDFLEGNDYDENDVVGDHGEMRLGVYVTGGALRTKGLDCPVSNAPQAGCEFGFNQVGPSGYTLGDMAKIDCAPGNPADCKPEEHADGEIWGQTLWDLRQRLVSALGGDTKSGAGVTRAREIITQGMRLAPPDPSFLDMRNAIIAAEIANGGVDQLALVKDVFADRGMGFFAADLGPSDTAPKEDFTEFVDCGSFACSSLSGRVTDVDTGEPIAGASVELLGIGSLSATTGADGTFTIADVPSGTYPYLVAAATGYDGVLRRDVAISGGGALDLQMKRNWASVLAGARVALLTGPDFSGDGCGPNNAFDQSLATTWGSTSPEPENPDFTAFTGSKSVTLALPRAVDIEKFAVDPAAGCGDDESASVRNFRIETSTDGATFVTAAEGSFGVDHLGKLNDVLPGAGTGGVKFVRFTMLAPFGLELVPDGTSYRDFMDVTEIAVYGKPAPTPPPPPTIQPPSNIVGPTISALTVKKTTLRKLARGKALSARMSVSAAGKVTGRLLVSRKTAFKLKLTKSRRGGAVQIGRAIAIVRTAGAVTVNVKLSSKARRTLKRRLRRIKSLAVTLNLVAADASGRSGAPVNKAIKIKR